MLTMAREYDYSVQLFDDPECEDWPLDRMPMRRAIRITRDMHTVIVVRMHVVGPSDDDDTVADGDDAAGRRFEVLRTLVPSIVSFLI